MPNRAALLVYSIAAVVGIATAFVLSSSGFPFGKKDVAQSFSAEKKYWSERIRAVGGVAAHAELVKSLASSTPEDMHYTAHVFGDALYAIEGIDGIVACDGKYLYGCSHAFVMRGLADEGTKAIPKLNEACVKRFGSEAHQCQHGIGHGVLGELGYTKSALKEALKLCGSVATTEYGAYWGCPGGVFMEYNFHWMEDLHAKPRPFVSKETFWEPCSLVDTKAAVTCAYWQPMWWMLAALSEETPEKQAQQMGTWCNEASDDVYIHEACIAGIAYRMPQLTNETPGETARFCGLATDNSDDLYICQRHSAVRFIYYHPLEVALSACAGLGDKESKCRGSAIEITEQRRKDQASEIEFEI